jgi:hypothetical protein
VNLQVTMLKILASYPRGTPGFLIGRVSLAFGLTTVSSFLRIVWRIRPAAAVV